MNSSDWSCIHLIGPSYSDPGGDEEAFPEGVSGQHEAQRGDPRAAGHLRRGGRRGDGHQRVGLLFSPI